MNKEPTQEEIKRFWERWGFRYSDDWSSRIPYKNPQGEVVNELPIDLNNLLKYAVPAIIVGIYFRYYPGGCECELTYITEGGFDTTKSWIPNETGDENRSKDLTALALFWATNQIIDNSPPW